MTELNRRSKRTHLLVNQREGLEPTVKHGVHEREIKIEGEEDRIGEVELERLEQGHLRDLLRRHLRLFNFGL